MADKEEVYEAKFASYWKEVFGAVKKFVDDTTTQIKELGASIDNIQAQVGSELETIKATIGNDLESVKLSLGGQIANLTMAVDRLAKLGLGTQADHLQA